MSYVKLFESILDSSLWGESPATTKVWITMLAMSDRDGMVSASVSGLTHRARVSREECEAALAIFVAPDPDSRSSVNEGRRATKVEGGWLLTNYEAYRDKESPEEIREKDRLRQRRKYERDRAKAGGNLTEPHASSRDLTHSPPSDQIRSGSDQIKPPPSLPPSSGSTAVPVPLDGQPKEEGRKEGDASHRKPEGPLATILTAVGYRTQEDPTIRAGRIRDLEADGLDVANLQRLWSLAQRQGDKPPGLLASWLDRGRWRDVLADDDLARKEAAIRARAPTPDDIGPVFGEPRAPIQPIQPLGFIGELALVKQLQAAESEPEPLQEPKLNPDSAWARRRARQRRDGEPQPSAEARSA